MAKTTKPAAAVEAPDDFAGVPGLGPVRKAALLAAGVTSRADLVRASVEQIVGMTGMGRVSAEKLHAFLQAGKGAEREAAAAASPSVAGDEALPEAAIAQAEMPQEENVPEEAAEPDATDTDVSRFDQVVFAARTALSDATRTFAASERLRKPFARLAKRLDTIEEKNAALKSGQRKRIEKRLVSLTDRLKKAAEKAVSLTPKREDKLRERVQNESRVLAGLLTRSVKRPAAPKSPPIKPSKNAKK